MLIRTLSIIVLFMSTALFPASMLQKSVQKYKWPLGVAAVAAGTYWYFKSRPSRPSAQPPVTLPLVVPPFALVLPTERDEDGRTPLMQLIDNDNRLGVTIMALIPTCADINVRNQLGNTALSRACKRALRSNAKDWSIVTELIKYGANLHNGETDMPTGDVIKDGAINNLNIMTCSQMAPGRWLVCWNVPGVLSGAVVALKDGLEARETRVMNTLQPIRIAAITCALSQLQSSSKMPYSAMPSTLITTIADYCGYLTEDDEKLLVEARQKLQRKQLTAASGTAAHDNKAAKA